MKRQEVGLPGTERGAVDQRAVVIAGGAIIVLAFAIWLFYPRPEPEAVPEPGVAAPEQPATEEERGDTAREIIADLRASSPPDYATAVERGREFAADGRLADAQLLYFFAARGGDPDAAFELGKMYDPNSFSTETSLMEEPDPFQAYKWYSQARQGGVAAAGERLDALHDWTEREAQSGNAEAEQLLLQWE